MFLKPSRTPSVSGKWWLATSGKPGIRSLTLNVFVLSGLGNLEGVSTSPLHSRYIQTLEHVYIIYIYIYLLIYYLIAMTYFGILGTATKPLAVMKDIGSQEDGTLPHVSFMTALCQCSFRDRRRSVWRKKPSRSSDRR